MRINGQRRIRSGHAGSHHKQEVPVEVPEVPPKKGKGVHWRDRDMHHERGHSSFMDLEISSLGSGLDKGDNERIHLADDLWYKANDFEEERKIVKSEFFRRLGETKEGAAGAEHSWNRLTAYSGLLGGASTLKPRKYDKERGDGTSPTPDGKQTPTPEASPLPTRGPTPNTDSGSFRRRRAETPDSGGDVEGGSFVRRAGRTAPVGLQDFRIHGLCGEGSFGRVMMATKIDTQKVYAVKVIRKELLVSRGDHTVSQAITEKQVLQQMASHPHPYVISLRYAFQTDDSIFLVMDLVGGGDLFQLLEAKGKLPEDWVVVYAAEVALALEHVHSHEVLFRDLKPENVMIGVDGHLKLTDFGLSKQLRDEATGPLATQLASSAGESGLSKARTRTICGTPEYIAPEVLQGKPYHSSIDWWTYGCLVFEMIHGRAPFCSLDMGSLVQLITRCRIKISPDLCSKTLESLLRQLITVDPEARLGAPPQGAAAVKSHPFFSQMDWEALMRKEIPAPCALSDVYHNGPEGEQHQLSTREKNADKLQQEFHTWVGGDEAVDEELQRMHTSTLRRVSKESVVSECSVKASVTPSPNLAVAAAPGEPSNHTAHGLSLELTREGLVWAISHALLSSLGYTHVGKQLLLGRSVTEEETSFIERADLQKFCGAFDKAGEALDERLQALQGTDRSTPSEGNGEEEGGGSASAVLAVGAAKASGLQDVTVWMTTASEGRACMQINFEVAILDASYRETGGPAGVVTLTMVDVTAAETKKAIVARRYELAYNEKAPDAVLADFFASWMEESTKAVPVPGSKRRPSGDDRLYGDGTAHSKLGVRQPGDPYSGTEISSGVRAYLQRRRVLITAFPDLHFTMLEQTSQGDSVYTSWQWTGTHLGPYPDDDGELAPSGARVHVHGISIDVFEGERIVDHSVFYDENAIRAQLEIKASASRGRDTRSIIRRAHNARKKLHQESSITVQLYLSVRKEHGGSSSGVSVGAMMRSVVSTAPRYTPVELSMMSTMETYYASKAASQIGSFATDGFCLCDGGESSSPDSLTRPTAEPEATAAASVILCSPAFANIVNLADSALLRADLHAILEPAMRSTNPSVARRLKQSLAKREAFHAVFEGRFNAGDTADGDEGDSSRRGSRENSTDGRRSREGRGSKESAGGGSSSGSSTGTPPGRVLVIDLAPFIYERRLYWSVLLSDLSDDLVLSVADLEGRERPPLPSADTMRVLSTTGTPSPWNLRRPQGGAVPTAALMRGTVAKLRGRPTMAKLELADRFIHCVPSSWCWFGCKMLQSVITAAVHANTAALSLSDLKGEDAPLVWIAEGFTRLNGWARNEVIGRNCRFLQSDASDPSATLAMRRAITARAHTRVYIWNEDVAGEGFWSVVSVAPGGRHDEQMANPSASGEAAVSSPSSQAGDSSQPRYMMGVQHRLAKGEMRFVFERVIAYRTAFWPTPPEIPETPETTTLGLGSSEATLPSPKPEGTQTSPPRPEPIVNSPPSPKPSAMPELKSALAGWRSDFVQLNGRGPTAEEATAMVAELIAAVAGVMGEEEAASIS